MSEGGREIVKTGKAGMSTTMMIMQRAEPLPPSLPIEKYSLPRSLTHSLPPSLPPSLTRSLHVFLNLTFYRIKTLRLVLTTMRKKVMFAVFTQYSTIVNCLTLPKKAQRAQGYPARARVKIEGVTEREGVSE